MPYLFGCVSAAAARVDAQHNGLDVIVVHQTFKVVANGFVYDAVFLRHDAPRSIVNDVSVSIIDSYFFSFLLRSLHVLHLAHAYRVEIFIRLLLQKLVYFSLYLVGIDKLVCEFAFHEVFRCTECYHVVSIRIQVFDAYFAAFRHVLAYVLPDAVYVCRHLLSVGVAHFVGGEHFGHALVLPDFRELHLHSEFGKDVFEEYRLRGNSVPVDLSAWI